MGYVNRVILTGRLTADPEVHETEKQITVARFRLATDRRFKNGQGEKVADFFPVVAFNGLAKICGDYLKKGRLIALEGRLQNRSYEKDGQNRTVTEVIAENLHMVERKFSQAVDTAQASA